MKNIMIIASCLVVFLAIGAQAQQHTPRINQRERHQHVRIQQGVATGEITKPEAQRLRVEQRGIRRTERVAKSDGMVTPQERMRIQRKQNRASRDIYRQKHDVQHRANPL